MYGFCFAFMQTGLLGFDRMAGVAGIRLEDALYNLYMGAG